MKLRPAHARSARRPIAESEPATRAVARAGRFGLRVIQALQTGGLCQAEWKPGQKTLNR